MFYLDDVLIEYIMIMILNKKNEKQMTDDLKMFLSSNSAKFSSWLSNYLKNFRENDSKSLKSSHHRHHHRREDVQHNNHRYEQQQSLELAIQIDSSK